MNTHFPYFRYCTHQVIVEHWTQKRGATPSEYTTLLANCCVEPALMQTTRMAKAIRALAKAPEVPESELRPMLIRCIQKAYPECTNPEGQQCMIENSNCLDRAVNVHGALEWRKPYFRAAMKQLEDRLV